MPQHLHDIVYSKETVLLVEPTGSFFHGTKRLATNANPAIPTATAKEALIPIIYARRMPGS